MSVLQLFKLSNNGISCCRSLLCSRKLIQTSEEQRFFVSSKTLEQLGIPARPKRPCSPYIRFFQSVRPKVKENNPDLKPHELVKVIAQEWSKYDPDKKKILQQEFLSDLEVYLKDMENYKQSITPEQQNIIESVKQKKKQAKEMARISEKRETLGKPKKPPTAFLLFMLEKKEKRDENLKHSEWIRRIAREWEIMPEEKKDKYKDESKIALDKYKSDMIAWEEDMIRQGHIDVIRNKDILVTNETQNARKKSSKTTA